MMDSRRSLNPLPMGTSAVTIPGLAGAARAQADDPDEGVSIHYNHTSQPRSREWVHRTASSLDHEDHAELCGRVLPLHPPEHQIAALAHAGGARFQPYAQQPEDARGVQLNR